MPMKWRRRGEAYRIINLREMDKIPSNTRMINLEYTIINLESTSRIIPIIINQSRNQLMCTLEMYMILHNNPISTIMAIRFYCEYITIVPVGIINFWYFVLAWVEQIFCVHDIV